MIIEKHVTHFIRCCRPRGGALLVTTLMTLFLAGCGDGNSSQFYGDAEANVPTSQVRLASESGCSIDDDCIDGLFCFQSQCTWECSSEEPCAGDEICSDNGRCLDPEKRSQSQLEQSNGAPNRLASVTLDEDDIGAAPTRTAEVQIKTEPRPEIEVDPGQAFVDVTLETTSAVPDGSLLYRIEMDGSNTAPRSMRSAGTTEFRFTIPTGSASGLGDSAAAVQELTLVTSIGGFNITLVPRRPVEGTYAGEVNIREFGGSAIPVRFSLRLEPSDASFEEAEERYIALPTAAQEVFSPLRVADDAMIERPMEFDAVSGVWFARFANPFTPGNGSQFSRSGEIVRAIRLEIEEITDDGTVRGALADRWQGLYDARSADGVVTPSNVVLSGRMTAHRVGPVSVEAREALVGQASTPQPEIGDLIPIVECGDGILEDMLALARPQPDPDAEPDAEPEPVVCSGVSSVEDFTLIDSSARAECALDMGGVALEGVSTAAQVRAFLDDDTPNPGGLSFGDFLERCADQDGYCVATPEMLCAGNLLAYAYQTQGSELAEAGELLSKYQDVARESYLGRQLAAFQVDTNIRLEWLQTSIAPLFLASALREYNENILNRWKAQVLDTHFDVLATQFAPSGLETLARTPTDPEALAVRKQFLLDQTQTWQGTMDALQIAATRWNALYQNDVDRSDAQQIVESRMFDLYLSAAVLSQLSRSSGSAGTNAVFGSGFAALLRSLEQLSLPFNELIFARDAEVVVSRSVDPSQSSQTLLSDREQLARTAVADAQQSVDRVLSDVQSDELNEKILTDRIQTQVEELGAELVALCGLPIGCSPADVGVRDECSVDVESGRCGFQRDATTREYVSFDEMTASENVSEAGQAMLSYREANLSVRKSEEEFRANEERARILTETADAFADKLEDWDEARRSVNTEVERLLDESTQLSAALSNAEVATIRAQQSARQQAYQRQSAQVAEWSNIRYNGIDADMKAMTAINALQSTADALTLAGDETDRLAAGIADGLPKAIGTSNDVSAPGRFALRMSAYGVTSGIRAVALGLDITSTALEQSLTEEQARRDAQLSDLQDLADLGAQQTQNQLDALVDNLREFEMNNETEIATREALIDALKRNLELDLAYERDLIELRDRRDRVRTTLTDSMRLRIEVLRTEVVAARRHQEYLQVVQSAQLIQGRYQALTERLSNLDILIASPSVIFAFANRLARAESRIDRAKTLLYDWLVALEYYAVRPFIDQRMAILLARNPSQLEAIANELVRLQRVCGGNVNYEQVDLSLRDDLLLQGFDTTIGDSNETLPAAERFRKILALGNVPVSTQVRYSTDERIGDVIGSRDVLAATFNLNLDEFANLAQACNAKVASVDVSLIGEDLGGGRPTVSILYDGTSALRSCQPNIDAIVGGLDPGTTSFGKITSLRTAGRSISPVAGVNAFGDDEESNRGLEGLPLSSSYTVLIDPQQSENKQIDWSRLEDVELRVTYVYQDLFPAGQCQ